MNKKTIFQSIRISLILLIICGFIYPFAITGIGQLFFKKQANGSMITYNGQTVGSQLIGQDFSDLRYFHGRISSIKYNTYESSASAASEYPKSGSDNLAPSNEKLTERVKSDIEEYSKTYGLDAKDIPQDLISSSASGLDPDISVSAAKIQIPLISKNTGIGTDQLNKIVKNNTKGKTLGIFGEERVNVLKANIEIDKLLKK